MPIKSTCAALPRLNAAVPPPPARNRKRLLFLLKFTVSLLLLLYVIWTAGLHSGAGRSSLLDTLRHVDWLYFSLSLLCGVLMTVISSWKWQVLLRCKGIQISLSRLTAIYFIGRFFNLFLPTSMGGDVVRIWELSRHAGEKYEAAASVLVERLSGMVMLALLSAAAVLLELRHHNLPALNASLLFIAAVTLLAFWLIIDRRLLPLFSKLLAPRWAGAEKLLAQLSRMQQAVFSYKDSPAGLLLVFAISFLFYFSAVVNVWVSALAFSAEVSFSAMLLAVPALMLIMNLPVSIGGIGLMEAAYALIFPLFGFSPALALSTALLMRLKTILYGIAGGFVHLARLRAEEPQA
uniref:lysylphosphatidylglycerol synthase transmembrane domain-containing protein n=1 Tax=Candidatus Electronema sp. TaxID=2698783 RepID=UPI004056EEE2